VLSPIHHVCTICRRTLQMDTKICTKCSAELPIEEFGVYSTAADGRNYACKSCSRKRIAEWRNKNPDKATAIHVRNYGKNREQCLENAHVSRLRRTYGLSAEDYARMLAKQKGLCLICFRPPTEGHRLNVDHDHETGKVRGLLCNNCNTAIGLFGEDCRRMSAAIEYLSNHEKDDTQVCR
jgi:hypothetical protein